MRIVIEKSILKVIEQKCRPEAGRDHFLPRDLVNPIRVFIDKELEQLNPKLYNLYKNRNYRGTDERTLRHAWGRGEKNQDGAIKELRDLLCYFGFSKNWDDTLKHLGYQHKNVQVKGDLLKSSSQADSHSLVKEYDESIFANRIYIELITRKAAIPIDLEKDIIEEIYNSWYKLFCAIRDELKLVSSGYFKRHNKPTSVIGLSLEILNEVLRPHLTEHQAKYRDWLDKEKRNPKNKSLIPQELQKKFPDYKNLTTSLNEVNIKLINFSTLFYNFLQE